MELLAGDTQMASIQLGNICSARQFRVADKPAHGLGRPIQGLSKLVEYPGQWPQICDHRILVAYHRCVRLHGFVHSCLRQLQNAGAQAILNRETDWRNSSAIRDSSRTWVAVDRVPSPVCSVTAKIC